MSTICHQLRLFCKPQTCNYLWNVIMFTFSNKHPIKCHFWICFSEEYFDVLFFTLFYKVFYYILSAWIDFVWWMWAFEEAWQTEKLSHTHTYAIIELSLSSNAVLQSIQSFQGQSDPPNLCSVQQSGWVGVGGEVRSCSFCLLRGDGYGS